MPVQTRGNFRNDPSNATATRPERGPPLSDARRARGPGFSLQYQQFRPIGWSEIDTDLQLKMTDECQITESNWDEIGRRAPCIWCRGNHWGVHCPGIWSSTPACREKVGDTVAEATRLKYEARRAAATQRQMLSLAMFPGGETQRVELLKMADDSEYVPVSRIAVVAGDDFARLCDLCGCAEDDDVDTFVELASNAMADSYMYQASAKARAA